MVLISFQDILPNIKMIKFVHSLAVERVGVIHMETCKASGKSRRIESRRCDMTLNEIAEDIVRQNDNKLAQAFAINISQILLSKGIQPIVNNVCEELEVNDDLNKYIIRKKYKVTFDVDTTEHDSKVIDTFKERLLAELDKTTLEEDGYYLRNIIIPLAEQMKKEV